MPPLPITVKTPLGKVVFIPAGVTVQEGVSQLFQVQVDAWVANAQVPEVAFEKLLGEKIAVGYEMQAPNLKKTRFFHGICSSVSQGASGTLQTLFRLTLVPQAWLWTKRQQSRIFQHVAVPEILKKALEGVDVEWQLTGKYEPRDYCVQYRESDFAFASRVMEEEGIFYYFKHTADGHKMIVGDSPGAWATLDPARINFDSVHGGNRDDLRIYSWQRMQEIRSGKFTLWDQNFELTGSPGTFKNLEGTQTVPESVQAGKVTHKLKVAGNDRLEVYDYPGFYADHFDGVNKGGGDQPAELEKIFKENRRYAELRMQQENASAVALTGTSNVGLLTPGHKFTLVPLEKDERGKLLRADGEYVLTSVIHQIACGEGGYVSQYENSFSCLPQAAVFKAPQVTPKPVVHGTQTAVVVGPKGEEIFTDKYSRVKVQFHWDRQGKNDADSSCWVRVGTPWAGKQWGMVHIPRIGQEVIVAFLEGDPDQPIIVGSVYNAEQMPPFKLPDNKTQSGLRTRSSLKGTGENFNELRFEDKKDKEQIYFHAEKDFDRVVENNDTLKVGFEKKDKGDQTIEIFNSQKVTIGAGKTQASEGSQTLSIFKDRTETLETGNDSKTIKKGNEGVVIEMGNTDLKVKMGNRTEKFDLGKSETEAMQSIELKVGQSSIKIDQMGVTIKGMMIKVEGTMMTDVKGLMTTVSGDAMLTVKGGITMIN